MFGCMPVESVSLSLALSLSPSLPPPPSPPLSLRGLAAAAQRLVERMMVSHVGVPGLKALRIQHGEGPGLSLCLS